MYHRLSLSLIFISIYNYIYISNHSYILIGIIDCKIPHKKKRNFECGI